MRDRSSDVLIVGAGPTGLFLALLLARLGVRPRIVDVAQAPGTTSRALAVQARTLEFYRQLDLADEVVRRGLVLDGVNLWSRGARAAHLELGSSGEGLSAYPFGLIFPQDEHESFLIERLAAAGVEVERGVEVLGIEPTGDRLVVRERSREGAVTTSEAAWVAGCDGARSTARDAIHATFAGGTYEHLFYVADVAARGAPIDDKNLHVFLDDAGFLGLFPLAGEGRARFVGTIRDDAAGGRDGLTWADVDKRPFERIGLHVDEVHWFSTYRVHHRVADRLRRDRVFLLGDAGHIHSPVGGQGMNTGLGDAMNLGWKLAAVIDGRAKADLLDTYEPERIAFARRLVATTDRVFQAVSSSSRIADVVRTEVAPRLVERVARTHVGRRLFFRTLSQIGIRYRDSAWSEGRAGPVHGGDRLPWVAPASAGEADNFAPLRSLDWQLHAYGAPIAPEVRARCESLRIATHAFPAGPPTHAAGLRERALYLVRPDGYVGAIADARDASPLFAYLDAHGIRGRAGARGTSDASSRAEVTT